MSAVHYWNNHRRWKGSSMVLFELQRSVDMRVLWIVV